MKYKHNNLVPLFSQLEQMLNNSFDDIIKSTSNTKIDKEYPPINAYLNEEDKILDLEVPCLGFEKTDISVYLENSTIIVEAFKEKTTQEDKRKALSCNLSKRNFKRKVSLLGEPEIKSATLKNGILYIQVMQKEPVKHTVNID